MLDARSLASVENAAARLADGLPWSPMDFVREISRAGDRAILAQSLTRQIEPANDLRLVASLSPQLEVAVCTERLPWDSTFFGYDVARLHGVFPLAPGAYDAAADYVPALRTAVQLATSRGIKYLFGVIDARDLPTTRALAALGFTLLETRLYFHRSLRAYDHRRRFRCRLATAEDVAALTTLAKSVANPYDRFNADPFIGPHEAERLIERWVRASVVERWADVTIVPDSPRPSALCTAKYHEDKRATWGLSLAQLVLALASPVGNRLVGVISETNYHLKERGADHVFFTTQVANRSAIRVAEHLGFKFGRAEHVFRLLL